MSPKAKAKELFKKYSKGKDEWGWSLCEYDSCAKKCALIAIDEILKNSVGYNAYDGVTDNDISADDNYWEEVKQELEKL